MMSLEKANLGHATTRELLDEIAARVDVDYSSGGGGLDYTTVDGRPETRNGQISVDQLPERNTAPEEKWLEVWSHLNPPETDVYGRLARLNWAVRMLVELLEPPSVRERRLNGE